MRKRYILICLIFTLLAYTTVANAFENATNQFVKINKIYGVRGYITFTNPSISNNSDAFSFQRVAVTASTTAGGSPAATNAEVGWVKHYYPPGTYPNNPPVVNVAVSYTDPSGIVDTKFPYSPTQTTHQYTVIWNSGNNQWSFYLDNTWVFTTPSTNFSVGSAAVVGGEVRTSSDRMAYTSFTQLQWLKYKPSTGQYVWKSWTTNQPRIYTGGFQCTTTSVTQHYCYP